MARLQLKEAEREIHHAAKERALTLGQAQVVQAKARAKAHVAAATPAQIAAAKRAAVEAAVRLELHNKSMIAATARTSILQHFRDAEHLKHGRMRGGVARVDHVRSRFYTVVSMV